MTTQYPALVHKDDASDFGVSFPDFPGCVSAGRTIEAAQRAAREALALHVAGMIEDGLPVPEPSDAEAVLATREAMDARLVMFVPLDGGRPRTVRINVSMPSNTLVMIDDKAARLGWSRSDLLVRAALVVTFDPVRGDLKWKGTRARLVKEALAGGKPLVKKAMAKKKAPVRSARPARRVPLVVARSSGRDKQPN